jgi:cytochrome P450
VGVNIYTMHHKEQYFADPYTFLPERWLQDESSLDEEAAAKRKLMYDAFTPFSIGSRGCGGKAMAYLEASLTIAKTLWYLDFRRPDNARLDRLGEGTSRLSGGKPEFKVKDQFSSAHQGPNLVFALRDGVQQELMDTILQKDS